MNRENQHPESDQPDGPPVNPDQPNSPEDRAMIERLMNPPDGQTAREYVDGLWSQIADLEHRAKVRRYSAIAALLREVGIERTRLAIAELEFKTDVELSAEGQYHAEALAVAISEGMTLGDYLEYSNIDRWRFRDAHREVARMRAENAERQQEIDAARQQREHAADAGEPNAGDASASHQG